MGVNWDNVVLWRDLWTDKVGTLWGKLGNLVFAMEEVELNAGRLVKFSKKFVAVGEFGQMRGEFGNGRELVEFMKSEVTGFV